MSRVQWIDDMQQLGDLPGTNCAAACLQKFGSNTPGYLSCVSECTKSKVQETTWPTWTPPPSASASGQPVATPTATAANIPMVVSPACLADCENKWGIASGNWNAVELAKCVAACSAAAAPLPVPGEITPGGGAAPLCPSGQVFVDGKCVPQTSPAPPATTTEAKKTPWGWIVLGGLALAGAVWAVMRGAGEVGGALAENPRSPRQQLEALVWKHTHRDFKGVREDGTKVINVNTGAGPFRGQGSYGTESWPLSKLTDEQLCYQLPRSVREQHPELCGGGARASNPRNNAVWGLGQLPENQIIQFPSGRWGFVGAVDARLRYERKDGSTPTPKELRDAASFGPGLIGLRTRSWATKEEALAAARALRARVTK